MKRGFTITEVLLAIALLAVVLLTLVGLTMQSLNVNQKATLLGPATQVADTLIERHLYGVSNDLPAGTRASFWNHSAATPWRGPIKQNIGGVDYEYVIYATTVDVTAGVPPAGGTPPTDNRVKKLDLVLWWWNANPSRGNRRGMGKLQVEASRLINESQ